MEKAVSGLPFRHAGLDTLRGIAIVLVLGRHGRICPDTEAPWLHAVSVAWQKGGWVGVDLFFALSGFLVGSLVLNELALTNNFNVARFLMRRGLKIYPAYWCCLMFSVIVGLIFGRPQVSLDRFIAELCFYQNYLPGLWNHTWTLAIEEHFYLLLTGLVGLSSPTLRRFIPWSMGLVLVLCVIARFLTPPLEHSDWHYRHVSPTHLRLDSLMLGALLAYIWTIRRVRDWSIKNRSVVLALGITSGLAFTLPFCVDLGTSRFMVTSGFSILSLASCLIIASLISCGPKAEVRSLSALGRHSYGIYLWHIPVGALLIPAMRAIFPTTKWWPIEFVSYIILSVVIGIFMTKLIESPILAIRDRVFPSPVKLSLSN